MKTSRIARILAAAALALALSAASAMAVSFNITGYTAGMDVVPDSGGTDYLGGPAGNADTFLNGAGAYTLSFSGTDNSHLTASLSLVGDSFSTVSSYTAIFTDIFAITQVGSIFTLSSDAAGNMLVLDFATAAPSSSAVTYTTALANNFNGQSSAYVNRVYDVPVTDPSTGAETITYFSYGVDGSLLSPAIGYGYLISDFFVGTTTFGTIVDMTVEDANVPVPEPGTFVLFGAGVAGLAFWRRRKA